MTIRKNIKDYQNEHFENIIHTAESAQKMAELFRDAPKDREIDPLVAGTYFAWAFEFIQDEVVKMGENTDYLPDIQLEETVDTVEEMEKRYKK